MKAVRALTKFIKMAIFEESPVLSRTAKSPGKIEVKTDIKY